MTRIPKDLIDGALYYVTVRGDHSEEIFKDKDDYRMYVQLLSKYKLQYGFKLFSFVLLSNHLHLLFELKAGTSISDIMHDLNTNYTKYFNVKYQRKGHLFQERSRMVLAEKDKYLLPILAYMHLNPFILGLVTDINVYPYSSHILYAPILAPTGGEEKGERIDLTEEIKEVSRLAGWPVSQLSRQLDNSQTGEQANKGFYTNFIKTISKDEMNILGKELAKKIVLGSDDFVKKVEQKMEEKKTKPVDAGLLNEYENKTIKQRKFIMAGSVTVLVLALFTIYLFASGLWLKESFNQELTRKDSELNVRLSRERKEIVQDLEEKHQADMVSYNAMAKRLEIEKQRARELEAKMDKSADNGSRSTN